MCNVFTHVGFSLNVQQRAVIYSEQNRLENQIYVCMTINIILRQKMFCNPTIHFYKYTSEEQLFDLQRNETSCVIMGQSFQGGGTSSASY